MPPKFFEYLQAMVPKAYQVLYKYANAFVKFKVADMGKFSTIWLSMLLHKPFRS